MGLRRHAAAIAVPHTAPQHGKTHKAVQADAPGDVGHAGAAVDPEAVSGWDNAACETLIHEL